MPTYQYKCNNCGIQDVQQSMQDQTLTRCPICDSIYFSKVFSKVGVQFKGKGFYSTDSKKG